MERLTDRTRAQKIKENADKLKAAGVAVSPDHELYIRLAEYENAEELQNQRENLCAEIINHYGVRKQERQLVEECAELIQAMTKLQRAYESGEAGKIDKALHNLESEVADVEIMLQQIKSRYINWGTESMIDYKLNRQLKRIEDEIEREGGNE